MLQQVHRNSSFRFRHWKRKAWAAFNSIGRHVTIGQLKAVVTDVLLGKQTVLQPGCAPIWGTEDTAATAATEDPPEPGCLPAAGLGIVALHSSKLYVKDGPASTDGEAAILWPTYKIFMAGYKSIRPFFLLIQLSR
ncbi:hypothetical protein [Niabella terrae]